MDSELSIPNFLLLTFPLAISLLISLSLPPLPYSLSTQRSSFIYQPSFQPSIQTLYSFPTVYTPLPSLLSIPHLYYHPSLLSYYHPSLLSYLHHPSILLYLHHPSTLLYLHHPSTLLYLHHPSIILYLLF